MRAGRGRIHALRTGGGRLARLAGTNHWAGIIVAGCIRDTAVIAGIDIGIKALGTNPG
jgi:regulator of ribonuclease activity A